MTGISRISEDCRMEAGRNSLQRRGGVSFDMSASSGAQGGGRGGASTGEDAGVGGSLIWMSAIHTTPFWFYLV